MPPRGFNFNPPANPFLQALYFVAGGVLLIGAILMGAVILAIALGIAIVAGLVVFVRVWWLKRKIERARRKRGGRSGTQDSEKVIEVEYTVVDERDDSERRR